MGTFASEYLHSIAKSALNQIDKNGNEKGIGYDGLVYHEGWWYQADQVATADILVSVVVSEAGETYRIIRRGLPTLVTQDFNYAERHLNSALGFLR